MRLRSRLVGEMRFAAQVGGENRERAEESISEIDVIAPTKILQQILKAPHSKSRVSVAVQRAGHTVVLNPGPDVAESERLIGKRSLGVSFQNYAEASLGLSPVSQQVPTLSWLEAWLDNVMDSVPELAICNHLNGVVQGYELLPDGISGDAPAVDPNVVQQNGLAVLRFLQSNCKKDPGVYWLYKSAGEEDLLQLFDLSTIAKNHSSSASSFPLVVRACAHEQFARFILNNEEEFDLTVEANNVRRKVKVADFDRVEESLDRVVNSASGTIGPVCQDRAPLTATSSISSHRAAVQHVILAIKSLTGTRQLMSSDQEVKWLPTSTLDRKLWSLVLLLGESYLSLGEAYKEDGQLLEALNIVELACSIFGSMPHKFGESLFASAMYTSFSRLIQFGKFDELLNHPSPSTTQDYISFREFPSVRIFWAKVWLMVGEIHVKFQISPLPEGYEVTKKEEMPFEIVEEVDKLKNKLTAHSRRCQFCLLVNCTCVAQKKNWGKGRGGIFKYLIRSCEGDAERNLLAALDCFQQTQRSLNPSDGKELQSLIKRKVCVWGKIGQLHLDRQNYKEAEEATTNAMIALKGTDDSEFAIVTLFNSGFSRRKLANEKKKSLHLHQTRRNKEAALKSTTLDFVASVEFYLAAEKELLLAIEKGFVVREELRTAVYIELGYAYRCLGNHLDQTVTTATAPHVLSSISQSIDNSSPGQLSAIDALRGALASYVYLGEAGKVEVARACGELARCHQNCCKMFLVKNVIEKANEHALLADENYQRSLNVLGPKSDPATFLYILLESSELSFQFQHQPNFLQRLESDLSRFLEGCHISKEDEKELDKKHKKRLSAFLFRLREILKNMVLLYSKTAGGANKSAILKELYLASLKATSLSDLHSMHASWTAGS